VTDREIIRISWSRLRNHDECPAKGDLLRKAKSPYTNIRDFYHGNVTDLLMRRWLSMDDPPAGWMSAQLDAVFEEGEVIARETGDGIVRWRGPGDKEQTRELCRELVKRLEPILRRYALPFDWDPAVRFRVPLAIRDQDGTKRQVYLVGEMDLMVRDNEGQIAVWDLKATRDNDYYRKVLGQLAFYAIAVKALTRGEDCPRGRFPDKVGLIQPMCEQQVLPFDVDPDAVAQMAARIERVARAIWAGELAPKAGNGGCSYCPVYHACPKFARPSGQSSWRMPVAA
jgi:hypothetical protein